MMDIPEVTQAPVPDGFWDRQENRAWLEDQIPVTAEPELPDEVSQFGFL